MSTLPVFSSPALLCTRATRIAASQESGDAAPSDCPEEASSVSNHGMPRRQNEIFVIHQPPRRRRSQAIAGDRPRGVAWLAVCASRACGASYPVPSSRSRPPCLSGGDR